MRVWPQIPRFLCLSGPVWGALWMLLWSSAALAAPSPCTAVLAGGAFACLDVLEDTHPKSGTWRRVDTSAEGRVERSGAVLPLTRGTPLEQGDRVVVHMARAQIALAGDGRVFLSRGSAVEVQDSRVDQILGFVVYHLNEGFRTNFGSVEAVVEGTQYAVDSQQEDGQVVLAEGQVAVRLGRQETVLEPGEQVAAVDGRLQPKQRWTKRLFTLLGGKGARKSPFFAAKHYDGTRANVAGLMAVYPNGHEVLSLRTTAGWGAVLGPLASAVFQAGVGVGVRPWSRFAFDTDLAFSLDGAASREGTGLGVGADAPVLSPAHELPNLMVPRVGVGARWYLANARGLDFAGKPKRLLGKWAVCRMFIPVRVHTLFDTHGGKKKPHHLDLSAGFGMEDNRSDRSAAYFELRGGYRTGFGGTVTAQFGAFLRGP